MDQALSMVKRLEVADGSSDGRHACSVFHFVFLTGVARWLVAKDRQGDALRILAKLHARGDADDLNVQAEPKEIITKINFEKNHPAPSYSQSLFGREWRRMWIGIGVVSRQLM